MEWDERVTLWRLRHFKVVERIIGAGAIGTQGTPVELLGRLIHSRLYPELWDVRNELTDRANRALMAVSTLRGEVTELLQELIRIDTVNPPGNETAAASSCASTWSRTACAASSTTRMPERATSLRGSPAPETGRASRSFRTRTPCWPTPRSGSAARGRATSTRARCGGAARST